MPRQFLNTIKAVSSGKILLAVFLVALAYRLWGITNPLLDFHSWRQTLTATVAQNFFSEGMNLFHPTSNFVEENYEFEFHLYSFIVALLYKVFGPYDPLGRGVSVAFSLGTMGMLFLLGKRYYDELTAGIAIAFLAVLPMSVYYSRTFMPESTMLFFSVSMLYFFTRWLDSDRWLFLILASGSAALAFLVKLPALYLTGPLLFLAWNKHGNRIFLQYKLYLFAAIALIPPWMWYSHMADLRMQAHGGENIWLANDKLASLQILTDYKFYKLIFGTRLVEKMFAFTAFPLLVLGMFKKPDHKENYVFHIWFACVCVYFLIAAKGNQVHEYYQVPIIPVGSIFIGKFLADFYRSRQNLEHWKKDFKVWVVVLMMVFVPIHSLHKLNKRLSYNEDYLKIRDSILEHAQKDDRVISQDKSMQTMRPDSVKGYGAPQLHYFIDRKGWSYGNLDRLSPQNIREHIAEGAKYYVMVKADLEKKNADLYGYLSREHQLLVRNSLLTLYKLTGPPA